MAEILCVILCAALACVTAFCAARHFKRKKQLEELTAYLMKLQDGGALPEWENYSEDAYGVLYSEMYKWMIRFRTAEDHMEKENAYLSKMLSDISHQLKTPLTSITLLTDLLKEPALPAEKRIEFAAQIDRQISRVTWLVRNLLTLSQLEANVLKLKKEDVCLAELLQKAAEPLELMAEIKEITIRMEIDPQIHLVCDAHWTLEAISNIIKNCLEHTPEGGQIAITALWNNLSVSLFIRDNGEGIPREELGYIFDRFYKGKNAGKNSVGIGLALAQRILLQQNGTISVKSEVGSGTEFHLKWYHAVSA